MAFSYYRSLTIDHTKCGSSNSSSFPVLVSISHSTFKTVANGGHVNNASGYDIIFTSDSAGATKIPWEVEFYDGTNGILVAWVNVATVSHTVDTVFYVFFDDATISTAQNTGSFAPTAVWDANYKGVWHLGNGSSLSLVDSTTNGLTLSNNNSVAAVAGQIDGGADSGASNSNKDLTYATNLGITGGSVSLQFWLKITTPPTSGNDGYPTSLIDSSSYTSYDILYANVGGTLQLTVSRTQLGIALEPVTVNVDLGTTNWHKIDLVDSTSDTTLRGYLDGSSFGTPLNTSGNGNVGSYSNELSIFSVRSIGGHYVSGKIDEYRVSNIGRSADWITTEWNNQNAPGNIGAASFITFGSETTVGSSSVSYLISDTNTLSDTAAVGIGIFLSDTNTLSDAKIILVPCRVSLSDVNTLSDTVAALAPCSIPVADTNTLLDTTIVLVSCGISFSDTNTLSDLAVASSGISISDTNILSDAATVFVPCGILLSDTFTPLDTLSSFSKFGTQISDPISFSDLAIASVRNIGVVPSIPIWHLQAGLSKGLLDGN